MSQSHSTVDILQACRVLFGPECAVTERFLVSLHIAKLRNTYRKRALELHPDRAMIVGHNEKDLTERFKDVTQAYQKLMEFISRGRHLEVQDHKYSHASSPSPRDPHWEQGNSKSGHPDHFWRGSIPSSPLLLGQFLYYSGSVSRVSLVESVAWQRKQRPPFGRISLMWDYMAREEISEVLSGRLTGERFGKSAMRLGYINRFQKNAVLGFQQWMQRPIGQYFIERELLREEKLNGLLRHQRRHNYNVKNGRR